MKADGLKIALECLRGSVSTQWDSVEIDHTTLRTSDGIRWAEVTLADSIPARMILCYSKLRSIVSIVKTLRDKADIEIAPEGASCLVKAPPTMWQLSLRQSTFNSLPEFKKIREIYAPGFILLEALKRLKHLTQSELSNPELKWAWTNPNDELVIGDGFRLGAYHTGIKGLELPVELLTEIARILAIQMSQSVIFQIGEEYVRATMSGGDIRFQTRLVATSRFPVDWYNTLKNPPDEQAQVMKMSRSELLEAVKQVRITAQKSAQSARFKLGPAEGGLSLTSADGDGNTTATKIEASGVLKEEISLEVDHLVSALEGLREEMIAMTVRKPVVELSDKEGWKIISGKWEPSEDTDLESLLSNDITGSSDTGKLKQ